MESTAQTTQRTLADQDGRFFVYALKNSAEDGQEVVQSQNIAYQWHHYENTPIQIYRKKITSKNFKFSDKNLW